MKKLMINQIKNICHNKSGMSTLVILGITFFLASATTMLLLFFSNGFSFYNRKMAHLQVEDKFFPIITNIMEEFETSKNSSIDDYDSPYDEWYVKYSDTAVNDIDVLIQEISSKLNINFTGADIGTVFINTGLIDKNQYQKIRKYRNENPFFFSLTELESFIPLDSDNRETTIYDSDLYEILTLYSPCNVNTCGESELENLILNLTGSKNTAQEWRNKVHNARKNSRDWLRTMNTPIDERKFKDIMDLEYEEIQNKLKSYLTWKGEINLNFVNSQVFDAILDLYKKPNNNKKKDKNKNSNNQNLSWLPINEAQKEQFWNKIETKRENQIPIKELKEIFPQSRIRKQMEKFFGVESSFYMVTLLHEDMDKEYILMKKVANGEEKEVHIVQSLVYEAE